VCFDELSTTFRGKKGFYVFFFTRGKRERQAELNRLTREEELNPFLHISRRGGKMGKRSFLERSKKGGGSSFFFRSDQEGGGGDTVSP